MKQRLAHIAFLVKEYDEAIEYYTESLGFVLVCDEPLPEQKGKRWVVVAPPSDDGGTSLLLARATKPEQLAVVGNQMGGRVGFFLHTDDFERDYQRMKEKGVEFTEKPRYEEYGTVVVFIDLYGNKWDLVEPKEPK
jgi:catechol 2,3-dioxygenase-like lactoylglutathione lyase family enzyme